MDYVIVMDSVASLPESFIKNNPIEVLPLTVMLEGQKFQDYYDEVRLSEIYKNNKIVVGEGTDAYTSTFDEINAYVLEEIVPKHDFAICQTIAKAISPIYDHYRQVASTISMKSREIRNTIGIERPFRMTYTSTGTMSTGQGLFAAYAIDFLSEHQNLIKYNSAMERFRPLVRTYTVIADVIYGRHRAKIKGNETVSFTRALIGKTIGVAPILYNGNEQIDPVGMSIGFDKQVDKVLEYAIARVKEGLAYPMVNLSIAGELDKLDTYSLYGQLKDECRKRNITVLAGMMSLATAINYGPGCISIALAPRNQRVHP